MQKLSTGAVLARLPVLVAADRRRIADVVHAMLAPRSIRIMRHTMIHIFTTSGRIRRQSGNGLHLLLFFRMQLPHILLSLRNRQHLNRGSLEITTPTTQLNITSATLNSNNLFGFVLLLESYGCNGLTRAHFSCLPKGEVSLSFATYNPPLERVKVHNSAPSTPRTMALSAVNNTSFPLSHILPTLINGRWTAAI